MFAILVHLKSPSFPWKPHFRRKSCGGSGLKLSDRRTAFSRSRFLNYSTPPNENDLLFTIIRTSGKGCKLKGKVSLFHPLPRDVTHQTVPALITLFQLASNGWIWNRFVCMREGPKWNSPPPEETVAGVKGLWDRGRRSLSSISDGQWAVKESFGDDDDDDEWTDKVWLRIDCVAKMVTNSGIFQVSAKNFVYIYLHWL